MKFDNHRTAGVGATEHDASLSKANTWMDRLRMAAAVGCAAAAIPYGALHFATMAALLVFPPIGIVLLYRYPLLFTVGRAKLDPRADVSLLIGAPAIGFLVSMMFKSDPSHLVEPFSLIPGFALIFVAFVGAIAAITWKSPARANGVFLLVSAGLGLSVVLVDVADTAPDGSSPSFFRTWIVRKYVYEGRRSNTYYLRVAPWGPFGSVDDVSVPWSTYKRSTVGDAVCIALHRGVLHAPWYVLVSCEGPEMRDAALSVPETASQASAILVDAQRNAARLPNDAHAQFVLGKCLMELERYDEALPPLLAAERLDSSNAWNRSVIGWVLNQEGRFAEAVPHLRAAVALDSTYAEAQGNLAWAYLKLNDLPDAERTYSTLVRLEPKNGKAAFGYAWVLERLHGAHAAEAETARALLLDPNNGKLQAFAGYLFRREARFAEARQHYEAASRLLPNDAAVWAELAATEYLMNDRAAAASAFAASVRLDPNYVRRRPDLLQMWREVGAGSTT